LAIEPGSGPGGRRFKSSFPDHQILNNLQNLKASAEHNPPGSFLILKLQPKRFIDIYDIAQSFGLRVSGRQIRNYAQSFAFQVLSSHEFESKSKAQALSIVIREPSVYSDAVSHSEQNEDKNDAPGDRVSEGM